MDSLLSIANISQAAAISFEGIAAVLSIVFFNKYKNSYLTLLPIFLLYNFINDYLGAYHTELGDKNSIYNIASVVSFSYFTYVYYRYTSIKKFKTTIIVLFTLYIVSYISNLFFQNFYTESLLFAYIFGGSILITCSILFFIEQLRKPNFVIVSQELIFWFSIGLLLFYVGYIPIKLARFYFENDTVIYIQAIIVIVHMILIIILNLSISLGLIWTTKNT